MSEPVPPFATPASASNTRRVGFVTLRNEKAFDLVLDGEFVLLMEESLRRQQRQQETGQPPEPEAKNMCGVCFFIS